MRFITINFYNINVNVNNKKICLSCVIFLSGPYNSYYFTIPTWLKVSENFSFVDCVLFEMNNNGTS